jgi:hypothetical protein
MKNEHGAIEERLENLERQNWRMKLTGLAMLVIAGVAVLMGQAPPVLPRTITAAEFVLVDAQGRTRADLEMVEGRPRLALLDEHENPRATLAALAEGSGLELNDANGARRVTLKAYSDGPGLALFDSDGTTRRATLSSDTGGPTLDLKDAYGFRTEIGVTGLISPETGETHKTTAASITMFGNNKMLWSALQSR